MKVLLKKQTGYATRNIRNNGEWVEVDTKPRVDEKTGLEYYIMFEDQYNIVDPNVRVFDKDIAAIKDDIRPNLVKINYNGWAVPKDKINEYLKILKETKSCEGCFWNRYKVKDSHRDEVFSENGEIKTETVVRTFERSCSHKEQYGGCVCDEYEKHGIKNFDECYFVKNPMGITSIYKKQYIDGDGFTDWIPLDQVYWFKVNPLTNKVIVRRIKTGEETIHDIKTDSIRKVIFSEDKAVNKKRNDIIGTVICNVYNEYRRWKAEYEFIQEKY